MRLSVLALLAGAFALTGCVSRKVCRAREDAAEAYGRAAARQCRGANGRFVPCAPPVRPERP